MLHQPLSQHLRIKFSNIRENIIGEHHVDARERESRVAVEQIELIFGSGAEVSGFHELGLSESTFRENPMMAGSSELKDSALAKSVRI